MKMVQTCPRRMEEFGPWEHEENLDHWLDDGTCSFCGSIKPDAFLERIRAGEQVQPTDKNYKAYIGERDKFYFQHFTEEQWHELVRLLNEKKVSFAYPGYFYCLPYALTVIS